MDIIFDVDGTLMDISHRKKFVESLNPKTGIVLGSRLRTTHHSQKSLQWQSPYRKLVIESLFPAVGTEANEVSP